MLFFKGVIALLEPPNAEAINTTVVGAKSFDRPVTPMDAQRGTDPTSIGFTFELSNEEGVNRYGSC